MKTELALAIMALALLVSACASPVIRKDLLQTGMRNVPPDVLTSNPTAYKGKIIILGGIIAKTTVTKAGTVIEAVFVPVDHNGYLKNALGSGRFLAVWPRSEGILDPLIYRQNRLITVAGTFSGAKEGKIGKASYAFPVLNAVQIFLWKASRYYPAYMYYPPYYGPYWGPYYGPYWGPGWGWGAGWGWGYGGWY